MSKPPAESILKAPRSIQAVLWCLFNSKELQRKGLLTFHAQDEDPLTTEAIMVLLQSGFKPTEEEIKAGCAELEKGVFAVRQPGFGYRHGNS